MNLIHLPSTRSTNTYLKELLEKDPSTEAYTIVSTDEQTGGRGQKGNTWESKPGQNLTISILLRPDMNAAPKARNFDLNIVASLAVRDVLAEHLTRSKVEVKWPNDILVNHKKVAGILIENEFEGSELTYSIVGIGVNINQEDFEDYPLPATSLKLEGGTDRDIVSISKEIAHAMRAMITKLPASAEGYRDRYHRYLYRANEPDQPFSLPGGTHFRGTLLYVEPDGKLVVRDDGTNQKKSYAFKEIKFEQE